MGKVIEKECTYGNDQYLFIGNSPIPLVQSYSYSYPTPSQDSSFLGERNSFNLPNGEIRGQLSLNTLLLSQDNLISFTGNVGVNGYLIRDLQDPFTDNFSFVSGYLTSYNQSYSVNSLPSVSTTFEVYKEMGFIDSDSNTPGIIAEIINLSYSSSGILKESALGGCSVTFPEIDSCPLLSYSINISCPRIPVYPINKQYPSHVFMGDSANVKVSFQMEKSNFLMSNPTNYPEITNITSFQIDLLDKNDSSYNSYIFNDMILDSSSLDISIDSPDLVSLVYRKKI